MRPAKLILLTVMVMAISATALAQASPAEPQPAANVQAPPAKIIPQPVSIKQLPGGFAFTKASVIAYKKNDKAAKATAEYLTSVLKPATGLKLSIKPASKPQNACVYLATDTKIAWPNNEAYKLTVTTENIQITAPTEAGLFYGVQTLRQLLPVEIFSDTKVSKIDWIVGCVEIEDHPRFKWRGMHMDVARHFMPKEFVMKFLDTLALHKMNSFHWHLTEDQGWRIEIKKYPKLTEIGSWRKETLIGHKRDKPAKYDGKRYGGFYTQDEIREVVAHAAKLHITIVPEIEMPGHSQAAIAAYPELGTTTEKVEVRTVWGISQNIYNVEESTITFLQDVLDEVCDLFPGQFIHIGGDEAKKTLWEKSPRIQERMKELGIKDEHELQSWFIRRMDTYLAEKGKRLVGWNEITEGGLAKGAVVMAWKGKDGGLQAAIESAEAGHEVVLASNKYTYFDHGQSKDKSEPLCIGGFLPLEKVYGFEPVPADLPEKYAKYILGAQGQLWTEYIPTPQHLEYMAFPRACALAEVVWSKPQSKDYNNFLERLNTHLSRLKNYGVNYHKLETAK